MITVTNIRPKARTVKGVKYESNSFRSDVYNADIEPGASIRLYGSYGNVIGKPIGFDKTFKVGDWATYDSYNLVYLGMITAIGPKTVTIQPEYQEENHHRLSLYDFAWRNWNFDLQRYREHNQETGRHI